MAQQTSLSLSIQPLLIQHRRLIGESSQHVHIYVQTYHCAAVNGSFELQWIIKLFHHSMTDQLKDSSGGVNIDNDLCRQVMS